MHSRTRAANSRYGHSLVLFNHLAGICRGHRHLHDSTRTHSILRTAPLPRATNLIMMKHSAPACLHSSQLLPRCEVSRNRANHAHSNLHLLGLTQQHYAWCQNL
jgi:hypothetical protein